MACCIRIRILPYYKADEKQYTKTEVCPKSWYTKNIYPDNLPLPLRFWNVQLMDTLLSHETKGIDL